jgi:hypothetical protein
MIDTGASGGRRVGSTCPPNEKCWPGKLIEWPAFDHSLPPGECPCPHRYGQTHELKIEIIETNRFQIGVKLPDLEGLGDLR